MKTLERFLLLVLAAALAACARPPEPPLIITDFIPAGSRVEYYAQLGDGTWKPTLVMKALPHDMHVRVAEKWALSAAQQRFGNHWQDYRFRVTQPGHAPAIVWQRRSTLYS